MRIDRLVYAVAAVAALLLTQAAARPSATAGVSAGGQAQAQAQAQARPGILLLAHGGSAPWNDNVRALAARVDKDRPVEVAFGMATRANIQTAVDKLVSRGVTEIVRGAALRLVPQLGPDVDEIPARIAR